VELFGGIHYADGPDPDNITRLDHSCLSMIHDFHRHGIRLDVPFLHSLNSKIRGIQEEIEVETNIYIEGYQYRNPTKGSLEPFKIGSRDHLAQLLFEHLKIQGDMPVPMTPSGKRFEVSEEIMEPFKNNHPVVPGIIEWHSMEKIRNTYTSTLPLLVDSESRVHTQFNATVAATGRLSSSNPNLQNISVRSKIGKQVRSAFVATPGWDLISVDYSQLEMCWAAHRSQDAVMMEVFRLGQDVHDRTTCSVFGYDYSKIMALRKLVESKQATPEQVSEYANYKQFKRLPCKTVGFGVLYGQTAEGLQKSLATDGVLWSVEQCEDLIKNKFFAVYPGLRDMLEKDYRTVRRYAMIWDAFGRVRLVPEAKSQIKRIANEGIRKAGNHPEQASGSGSCKIAMARLTPIFRKFPGDARPLLQIHDQIIGEARKEISAEFAEIMREQMELATPLSIPLRSSSDIGERWSDL
jgi:DNA polymerase-1